MGLKDRLRRLEDGSDTRPEDECEQEKACLTVIREEAQRLNKSFFREIARGRRGELLDRYESAEAVELAGLDLSDEALVAEEEEAPPFTIAEDGRVFCSCDDKPVTDQHQLLAELWYWDFAERHHARDNPRKLIHDEERQAFYMPEYPHELAFSRERCYLNRYFWALGDERANPGSINSAERL